MRKHPAAVSCASKSSGSRRPASISALRALIEGARSRIESSRIFASRVIALLCSTYPENRNGRVLQRGRVFQSTRFPLCCLFCLLDAGFDGTFSALTAGRALGLVSGFVATGARHDVAGGEHLDEFAHRGREFAAALVDDRERTEIGSFLELEHPQSTARDFVLDGHPRHNRASQPNLDRALDRLDV